MGTKLSVGKSSAFHTRLSCVIGLKVNACLPLTVDVFVYVFHSWLCDVYLPPVTPTGHQAVCINVYAFLLALECVCVFVRVGVCERVSDFFLDSIQAKV